MSKLTILHLSDAHWSEAKAHAHSNIITHLNNDLDSLAKRDVKPDILIFSGDLVQAGENEDSFERAYQSTIDPITKKLGITSEQVFICPGNHDISRRTAREQALLEEGLKNRLVSEEALNDFVERACSGAGMEVMALARST